MGPTFSPKILENFGEVKVKKLIFDDENYQKEILNFKGNVNSAAMISQLVLSKKRTNLICAYIDKFIKDDIKLTFKEGCYLIIFHYVCIFWIQ